MLLSVKSLLSVKIIVKTLNALVFSGRDGRVYFGTTSNINQMNDLRVWKAL